MKTVTTTQPKNQKRKKRRKLLLLLHRSIRGWNSGAGGIGSEAQHPTFGSGPKFKQQMNRNYSRHGKTQAKQLHINLSSNFITNNLHTPVGSNVEHFVLLCLLC